MTITAAPVLLTGPDYDQAHNTVEDALAPMLDKDGPNFVVGYLASFIAGHGLADALAAQLTPQPTPAEQKVNDLMDALAASVDAAKAARRAHEARPHDRCWRCENRIGGCMTEGCPGRALDRLEREGEWT